MSNDVVELLKGELSKAEQALSQHQTKIERLRKEAEAKHNELLAAKDEAGPAASKVSMLKTHIKMAEKQANGGGGNHIRGSGNVEASEANTSGAGAPGG